ncbi:MAG TPA: hypothetical protein VE546_17935 [Streptomyces sp.]|uniref:hypothetical protein n=1 Tax=Streptomyces sp. TaxID=1931 RepID=UPI002D343F83|nr:hypothetical protein [Streptomyces sp.]HZG05425.1 hypothetical protein [Streptomyces sp.]
MNSAPHLRLEDRPEFERVLDEALRTVRHRPDPAAGRRLTTEQLRIMALGAAAAIAACAAEEYDHFVRLREELRRPDHAPSAQGTVQSPAGASGSGGPGLLPMLSVLAPLLAGTAAVIFLLVGHVLRMMTPEPSIAAPMRGAGWAFAALTAVTLLAACAGLLVTALRHGAGSVREGGPGGQDTLAEEVARARTAWRTALLERGMVPFLREALAAPGGAPASREAPKPPGEGRHPRLGYTHPGFSSPGADTSHQAATGPRFTSPDFTSPDFGGPEHAPD